MRILFGGKVFERLWEYIESVFSGHELLAENEEAFPEVLPWAEVLVARPMKIDGALLDMAPNLRLIHQWGTGVEGIDLQAVLPEIYRFVMFPPGERETPRAWRNLPFC